MVETDGHTLDMEGYANAVYDAFDRPFMFGCRTNGALRWDDVRMNYGIAKQDYKPGEKALADTPAGNNDRMFFWQAETESFPTSRSFGPERIGYEEKDFSADYVGIVESTLATVYLHSRHFMIPGKLLYVAGGPTQSPQIIRRIAAIWNRQVVPIEKGGAALGAAVSGAYALLRSEEKPCDPTEFGSSFLKKNRPVEPRSQDVKAYHDPRGFLKKYETKEAQFLAVS